MRENWETRKANSSLGPNHPDTLASKENLAAVLRDLGRSDEAEAL